MKSKNNMLKKKQAKHHGGNIGNTCEHYRFKWCVICKRPEIKETKTMCTVSMHTALVTKKKKKRGSFFLKFVY